MPNDPSLGRTTLFHLVMINNTFHDQVLRRPIEPKMGWRVDMIDGLPTWTPPAWIDPDQKPIRNRRHQPTLC